MTRKKEKYIKSRVERFCFLYICIWVVCSIKQIVNRYIVIIGKLYQNRSWNINISAFIIAIYALTTGENCANLSLRHIPIFP